MLTLIKDTHHEVKTIFTLIAKKKHTDSQVHLLKKSQKKILGSKKKNITQKKLKRWRYKDIQISQSYDISFFKPNLNDEYHTTSKVKRSQKNQKKNKRLVRALIIVELYARILNSTLLPAQSLNREGEIKTLNNPQNPLHN
jgi:hypothetical protein